MHRGLEVFFLMNITDIDDSIVKAARQSGEDPLEYSKRMASTSSGTWQRLKVTTVSRFEPVSPHIEDMRSQLAILLRRKFAYRAGGWVYFDISKFRGWGKLSHQSRRELSMRPLELSPKKRNLTDFALWRPESRSTATWQSPWGPGSPGWHMQDTSVTLLLSGRSMTSMGVPTSLSTPTTRRRSPRQSQLTGVHPLVRYWVHTNLREYEGTEDVEVSGERRHCERRAEAVFGGRVPVLLPLHHYRKDMDLRGMDAAARRLRRMRRLARVMGETADAKGSALPPAFQAAMNDDFDTPRAIDSVERTLKAAASLRDPDKRAESISTAASALRVLGVNLIDNS